LTSRTSFVTGSSIDRPRNLPSGDWPKLHLTAGDRTSHGRGVAQIGLDQLDLTGQRRQVFALARAEVVEHTRHDTFLIANRISNRSAAMVPP
jgi:ABC-type thiamine transport system ATPase subunit